MKYDRMFRVIVLGGVALTSAACSASVTVVDAGATDAGPTPDFPREGPQPLDVPSIDHPPVDVGFPQEGPAPLDVPPTDRGFPHEGPDVRPPDTGAPDVFFPHEGPRLPDVVLPSDDVGEDAGTDAGVDSSDQPCFPRETAIAWDC